MTSPTLFDTPELERRVRSREAETSWSVAPITAAASQSVKDTILRILAAHGPMTDDELCAAYRAAGGKRTPQRVRTAREELVHPKSGEPQVKEYTFIGISAAGNAARRWVIA